jgi:lipopolysaccharide/colanic/teichoic acid biosynthesis glycosyltransferase
MRVPVPTSRAARRVHLSAWDLIWAVVCPFLALYLRDALALADGNWGAVISYWALSTSFTLLAFYIFRIHDEMAHYFSIHNTIDIARAVILAVLLTCMALFVLNRLDGIPRSTPIIHGLLLASALVATRTFVSIVHGEDTSTEYQLRFGRTILIGANRFSSMFIKLLNAYGPDQQRVIGLLDERPAMVGRAISGVRILGVPQHLEAIIDEFLVHGVRTEQVVIAGEFDLLTREVAREVERVCEERQIKLSLLPRMIGADLLKQSEPTAAPKGEIETASPGIPSFFGLKRWIDIVASSVLILTLLPLFAMVGLLVMWDVGTPVLFWQRRLGRNGRSFLIYKFRTLRAPFDSEGWRLPETGRLSATGRLLRATRLDELPQLLNVLTGNMSLIGPRPLLPEDQPKDSVIRLSVRPGITGWAQVNGGKLVSREEKEKLDEWYVRNASLSLDFRISIMTLKLLLKMNHSSEEALADATQAQSRNVLALRANQRQGTTT